MLGGNAMCLATPRVLQFWTPTFDAGLSNEVSKVFGTQKPTTIRPKWNKSPNYFTYKDYNLAFLERGGPIRVIILTKNAINVHVWEPIEYIPSHNIYPYKVHNMSRWLLPSPQSYSHNKNNELRVYKLPYLYKYIHIYRCTWTSRLCSISSGLKRGVKLQIIFMQRKRALHCLQTSLKARAFHNSQGMINCNI